MVTKERGWFKAGIDAVFCISVAGEIIWQLAVILFQDLTAVLDSFTFSIKEIQS